MFQRFEDFVVDEVIADPGVVAAVRAIRSEGSRDERLIAVNELVERIG